MKTSNHNNKFYTVPQSHLEICICPLCIILNASIYECFSDDLFVTIPLHKGMPSQVGTMTKLVTPVCPLAIAVNLSISSLTPIP